MTERIRTNTILHNRYQVQRELGRGGMGAVYLAQDLRNRRPVAIKVARLASPEAREQFRREAGYLQKLHHHSLPRVWEVFSDTQTDFLVMEYIPGDDLETLVQRKGPQPEWLVLRWAEELLDGLAYLHGQSPPIIHRDIKPGNLKLRQDETLVLVDFGIAKEYVPGVDTVAGATAVTPGFSPPEQYSDSLTDARSDLYSVGAAMYFLLTGVAPAPAPARAAGDQKLLAPSALAPGISTATEMVMRRALSLAREGRWDSASEMAQALDLAAQRQTTQPPPGKRLAVRSQSKPVAQGPVSASRPWPLLLGLLALVIVAAGAIFLLLSQGSGSGQAAATPTMAAPEAVVATSRPPAAPTATLAEAAVAAPLPAVVDPTATPSRVPTATPEPTSTPIPPRKSPTAAATTPPPKPTATATAASRATPTTAAVATVPPTSAPPAVNVSVALLEPNDGDTRSGEVAFRWAVTGGSLPADQAFEVFFYKAGQNPLSDGFGLAAPTTGNALVVNLAALDADANHPLDPGPYLWSVRLVPLAGGRPGSVAAEGRRIVFERGAQSEPAKEQPTEGPPTPVSRSFVPDADEQDVGAAGRGGALGVGLFTGLMGLTYWKQRRKS